MTPEDLNARLLYRDGLMLVINKPPGIPVHRGPKGGENLEQYFDALRFGLPRAPSLAHRLDRDTSGCLVLGRHRKALEKLAQLFKQGKIDKTYWAVVEGIPAQSSGEIDMPLGRRDSQRGWWMKVDPLGQPSKTIWRVLGSGETEEGKLVSWLELEPVTGRTHQLRVHCAAMGWPIVKDPIYGTGAREDVLHLHSRSIIVPMSKNKEPVHCIAPVPAHMEPLLERCGWTREMEAQCTVLAPRPQDEDEGD